MQDAPQLPPAPSGCRVPTGSRPDQDSAPLAPAASRASCLRRAPAAPPVVGAPPAHKRMRVKRRGRVHAAAPPSMLLTRQPRIRRVVAAPHPPSARMAPKGTGAAVCWRVCLCCARRATHGRRQQGA
jgi:hypothetical protein